VLKSFNYHFVALSVLVAVFVSAAALSLPSRLVYGPAPDPGPLRTPLGWRSVAVRWLE
jgi:hypothetical protein